MGEVRSGSLSYFSELHVNLQLPQRKHLILKNRTKSSGSYVNLRVPLFRSKSVQRVLKETVTSQSSVKISPQKRGKEGGRSKGEGTGPKFFIHVQKQIFRFSAVALLLGKVGDLMHILQTRLMSSVLFSCLRPGVLLDIKLLFSYSLERRVSLKVPSRGKRNIVI